MRRKRLIAARERLLGRLPLTGELLRGSLLERTIRNHARNCNKCASGGGHRLTVLTVSYPGGRTRQFSLRGEMVPLVRRWLANSSVPVTAVWRPLVRTMLASRAGTALTLTLDPTTLRDHGYPHCP